MTKRVVDVPQQSERVERAPVGKEIDVAAHHDRDAAFEQRVLVERDVPHRTKEHGDVLRRDAFVQPRFDAFADAFGFLVRRDVAMHFHHRRTMAPRQLDANGGARESRRRRRSS